MTNKNDKTERIDMNPYLDSDEQEYRFENGSKPYDAEAQEVKEVLLLDYPGGSGDSSMPEGPCLPFGGLESKSEEDSDDFEFQNHIKP